MSLKKHDSELINVAYKQFLEKSLNLSKELLTSINVWSTEKTFIAADKVKACNKKLKAHLLKEKHYKNIVQTQIEFTPYSNEIIDYSKNLFEHDT